MFNQLHQQFRISKQVLSLATVSYWSAIETTLGNDRAPNSICGVQS